MTSIVWCLLCDLEMRWCSSPSSLLENAQIALLSEYMFLSQEIWNPSINIVYLYAFSYCNLKPKVIFIHLKKHAHFINIHQIFFFVENFYLWCWTHLMESPYDLCSIQIRMWFPAVLLIMKDEEAIILNEYLLWFLSIFFRLTMVYLLSTLNLLFNIPPILIYIYISMYVRETEDIC